MYYALKHIRTSTFDSISESFIYYYCSIEMSNVWMLEAKASNHSKFKLLV